MAEDSQAKSTRLGEEKVKEQENILIVCFSFSVDLPSEIIIFEPTVCPPMASDSPEIGTRLPKKLQDGFEKNRHGPNCGNYRSKVAPKTDHESSKVAPRLPKRTRGGAKMAPAWPQDGPREPQDGPRELQDGPHKPQEGPKIAPEGAKMTPRWPNIEQDSRN